MTIGLIAMVASFTCLLILLFASQRQVFALERRLVITNELRNAAYTLYTATVVDLQRVLDENTRLKAKLKECWIPWPEVTNSPETETKQP